MKVCSKCNINKNNNQFNKLSKAKDGLRPDCRLCQTEYYSSNKEKFRSYGNNYYNLHKEEINKIRRSKNDKIFNKIKKLKYVYKMSIEDFNKLLNSQDNKCAICNRIINLQTKNYAVDHNHQNRKYTRHTLRFL